MKILQRLGAVLCLSLALVMPVLAGDMDTGAPTPPPPSASQARRSDIGNAQSALSVAANDQGKVDPLREFARSVLESVLLLF